ncbi:MAG: hypothetical protein KF819_08565 [Labilithrix sp.]|nr:hypothetical protein [Labilithrix sp.]
MRTSLVGGLVSALIARAAIAGAEIDPAGRYPIDTLTTDGLERTAPETVTELLPRPLPTTLSGVELVELRRRIKNLALFDLVEVEPVGRVLEIKVRRKTTLAPIVDLSTGKTLSDTKVTLGAIEHDIDGHATRLGGKASYSERGLNFALWLHQHVYRPDRWANEYDVYYSGSGFRFEGADAGTTWHRNRFGGEAEFLSPFSYGTRFRYELQINVYRELLSVAQGANVPRDGVYFGTTSELIYDQYTWNDLTPAGFRAAIELRPGVFFGAVQPRHEVRAKAIAAIKLSETGVVVFNAYASAVNTGNANHSGLIGSQQGVRGLPDSLYRTRAQAYANLELRQALSLGKRWYLQGVFFSDAAAFEPMNAAGEGTQWKGAWATGAGMRLLPTALVDTLLRVDVSRLHYPTGAWFVGFGINQYI